MSYYNSEEEFLSAYTAFKLCSTEKLGISKEELEDIRFRFMCSSYCGDQDVLLDKLDFSDLEAISERFQARINEIAGGEVDPCFEYKDGKLYPTYEFYDFTGTASGEFVDFLKDYGVYKYERDLLDEEETPVGDIKYLPIASQFADFITECMAESYINEEIRLGRWPAHKSEISNIFEKDLGAVLELKGTKARFESFRNNVCRAVTGLLTEGNGELELSNVNRGNLAYRNFIRATMKGDTTLNPTFYKMKPFFAGTCGDMIYMEDCCPADLADEERYEDPYEDIHEDEFNQSVKQPYEPPYDEGYVDPYLDLSK